MKKSERCREEEAAGLVQLKFGDGGSNLLRVEHRGVFLRHLAQLFSGDSRIQAVISSLTADDFQLREGSTFPLAPFVIKCDQAATCMLFPNSSLLLFPAGAPGCDTWGWAGFCYFRIPIDDSRGSSEWRRSFVVLKEEESWSLHIDVSPQRVLSSMALSPAVEEISLQTDEVDLVQPVTCGSAGLVIESSPRKYLRIVAVCQERNEVFETEIFRSDASASADNVIKVDQPTPPNCLMIETACASGRILLNEIRFDSRAELDRFIQVFLRLNTKTSNR